MLHELFHLNSFSYRVKTDTSNGRVFDLWVEYYEADEQTGPKRKVPVYSPYYTKILANYRVGPLAGRLTSINGKFLFCSPPRKSSD